MKEHPTHSDSFPSGRYEAEEGPAYRFDFNRRQFLKAFSGGLAVALVYGTTQAFGAGDPAVPPPLPDEVGAWLHIGEDGRVTVYTGKVEVGQNIRTSLAQAVAEELRVPFGSVTLVMGDTDHVPYDRGTFGSRSTPQMGLQLKRAGAAAREALLGLAADRWKADRGRLTAADGKITNPATGKTLSYGELTKGQKLMTSIREEEALTAPEEWKVIGTTVPKVNGRDFVTGRHKFASDWKLPGMWYGRVLRPPAYGAELVSLGKSAAEAIENAVVVHDGNFIGVAAADPPTAARALAALRAEWKTTPQPSRAELFELLKSTSNGDGGRDAESEGSIDEGLARAGFKSEQTYLADYIAHAPLEPRAGLAQWEGDKLTVWTGTQRPFGVREELAEAFRLPVERVRVLMPDTGSGYGGKHTGEAAIEAARLAKAAGRPVRVNWTRQEEFTWAYFRPAARIEVRAGADKDGLLTAWEFLTYNAGGAGIESHYETPNRRIAALPSQSPLRQGSYRGLAATVNHFARESHMDELAHLTGIDPLAFRLKNLKDERFIAVLNAAADAFGWRNEPAPPGHGYGLAAGFDKGGYVATCAEVAVNEAAGSVKVVRVTLAFECGGIVNPDHLRNQVEGGLVQGLGGALFEGIDFADGRILNPFFSTYRVPRFADMPDIDIVLLDRRDIPSAGAGETPIVGIAPAIGNAIFDATGVRLRAMPLVRNGWEG